MIDDCQIETYNFITLGFDVGISVFSTAGAWALEAAGELLDVGLGAEQGGELCWRADTNKGHNLGSESVTHPIEPSFEPDF